MDMSASSVIVEIRAAEGGDDALLFAEELARAYEAAASRFG